MSSIGWNIKSRSTVFSDLISPENISTFSIVQVVHTVPKGCFLHTLSHHHIACHSQNHHKTFPIPTLICWLYSSTFTSSRAMGCPRTSVSMLKVLAHHDKKSISAQSRKKNSVFPLGQAMSPGGLLSICSHFWSSCTTSMLVQIWFCYYLVLDLHGTATPLRSFCPMHPSVLNTSSLLLPLHQWQSTQI